MGKRALLPSYFQLSTSHSRFSRSYTHSMNYVARYLIAAALLATLASCGNKGPLVRPSAVKAHKHSMAPPANDPTDTTPVEETPPPPAVAPAPVAPPATPGSGHG